MTFPYFYLDIELSLKSGEHPDIKVQQLIQGASKELFGECGVIYCDILCVYPAENQHRVLVRVPATNIRKLRAALTLCTQVLRVHEYSNMSTRTIKETGEGGKDIVIIASREELSAPSTVTLPEPPPAPGLIHADGSINWSCPCLGGMATGPCGTQFRDAFSCFHYSEADPKGSECYEKFSVMQDCMSNYPELYGKDEDDEELAAALDKSMGSDQAAGEPNESKSTPPAVESVQSKIISDPHVKTDATPEY